jgi:hypothetical protein
MATLARWTPGRFRALLVVVVVVQTAGAAAIACSSGSQSHPPELGGHDVDGSADHNAPEASPEAAPDASDGAIEAEAGCQAGDSGALVTPTTISFGDGGLVGCGSQAQSVAVTITNQSCAAFNFTASLTSGATFYTVSPTSGSVPVGASQPVLVIPNAIPHTSAVTPDLYEGTVNITTTSPGDTTHPVQLHMTAYGAILASQEFGSTLSLGQVAIGKTGSAQFSVANTGNADTTVTFSVGSAFFTVGGGDAGAQGSFDIPANQPVAPQVTFSPIQVQPYVDAITTTVSSATPLCATPPANIALTGSGTTGVAVSPGTLDFGRVECGQAAAAFQPVTVTNTGAAITFTPVLGQGSNSPYTLADGNGNPLSQGVAVPLAAASAATVRVIPKAIVKPATTAANGYGDTLTITTTGAGDSPHTVTLSETAQGTIFTLSPPTISATANPGVTVFENFTVGNTGNEAASYTLTLNTSQGPSTTFSSNLPGGNLGPASTQPGVLSCVGPPAVEGGTFQALGTLTLTPASGTILCADPPPPMPLSVTN